MATATRRLVVRPSLGVLALLYLILAAADTVLTLEFAQGGWLREANPLLLRAASTGPWSVLALKAAGPLVALLLIVRAASARAGRRALEAATALYAAVDVYWLLLLLR